MTPLKARRLTGSAIALAVAFAGAPAKAGDDIFDKLVRHGFSLQNSFDAMDEGQPAGFSFLASENNASFYQADFALKQRPVEAVPLFWSAEGHVAAAGTASQDAWRARLSMIEDQNTRGIVHGINHSLSLEAESDQYFDTNKFFLEYLATPSIPRWWIGTAGGDIRALDEHGHRPKGNYRFRWRPFAGAAAGATANPGQSSETQRTLLRLIARVRAELFLDFMSTALDMNETTLYVEDTYVYVPLETDSRSHQFLNVGLSFALGKDTSLSVEYKFGEDSPVFSRIKTLGVELGVKFGKSK
jgi:hypothetical protein